MRLNLTIESDNAAFDEPEAETARILRDLAKRIECGNKAGPLIDFNGNRVGYFTLDVDDEEG